MAGFFDGLQDRMLSPLFLGGASLMSGEGMGGAMRGMAMGSEFADRRRQIAEHEASKSAFQNLMSDPSIAQSLPAGYAQILQAVGPEAGLGLIAKQMDPMASIERQKAQAELGMMPLEGEFKRAQIAKMKADSSGIGANTDDVKEYNFARQQGFNGSFMDFKAALKGRSDAAAPAGYRFNSAGALDPIPGGPADKLTENESKDALFAERMLRSERDLANVAPTDEHGNFTAYNPAQAQNVMFPDKGAVANIFNSKEWQQYQRAARESLSAILRKDTGAAVTDEEFNTYFPTYFPIPGDSPEVVKQKEVARRNVGIGLRNSSSRAFNRMFPDYDKTHVISGNSSPNTAQSGMPDLSTMSTEDLMKLRAQAAGGR